jgi:hypothetical protein
MTQQYEIEIDGPLIDPLNFYRHAAGIFGDRLKAVGATAETLTFTLAAPHLADDGATCNNIVEGTTVIPLTATPAAPEAGDNVAVTIGDATGDYAWTWRLNGEVIDDSDASGVASVGDYVIDVAAIESGTHEIEVRKPGKYGYLRIEVT